MTTANELYLLMVIGVFVAFSAMLAYVSWLQSRRGPDYVGQAVQHPGHVPHEAPLPVPHPPLAA